MGDRVGRWHLPISRVEHDQSGGHAGVHLVRRKGVRVSVRVRVRLRLRLRVRLRLMGGVPVTGLGLG